jgi:hypothetical protein
MEAAKLLAATAATLHILLLRESDHQSTGGWPRFARAVCPNYGTTNQSTNVERWKGAGEKMCDVDARTHHHSHNT